MTERVDGNKYTVYAPSGKLGLVFDTFDDSGPMVCIVHESSPLFHRVQVGDRLIGVDEVNVVDMSPTKVCRLLGQRSRNPIRKLTLVRKIERPEEPRRSKRYQ
jgi:C-terminal processing protease CtpA/Prc